MHCKYALLMHYTWTKYPIKTHFFVASTTFLRSRGQSKFEDSTEMKPKFRGQKWFCQHLSLSNTDPPRLLPFLFLHNFAKIASKYDKSNFERVEWWNGFLKSFRKQHRPLWGWRAPEASSRDWSGWSPNTSYLPYSSATLPNSVKLKRS